MRLISDIEAAWHLDDSTPPLLSETAQAAWAAYHRQVSDLEQGAAQPSTNSARILDFASFKASAARKPSRATAR